MQSQNGFDLVQLEFKIVSGPKDNTITRVNKLYLLCLSSELYTMAANIPLPYSSLHNVIFDSFCVLFILWSLLNGKAFLALFLFLTSQLFKKVPMETESPHSLGGTNTFLALLNQIYYCGDYQSRIFTKSQIFFGTYSFFQGGGENEYFGMVLFFLYFRPFSQNQNTKESFYAGRVVKVLSFNFNDKTFLIQIIDLD